MTDFFVREYGTLQALASTAQSKKASQTIAEQQAAEALRRSAEAKAAAEEAEVKRVSQIDYVVDELNALRDYPEYVLGTGPRTDPSPEDREEENPNQQSRLNNSPSA